ncbi:MAG: carbohydrate ABC transporter permease [Lachnotalea sp.]
MTVNKQVTVNKQKKVLIILFLLIPMLHLIIFSYIPIFFNVYLSFSDWKGIGEINFVGLTNYKRLLTDTRYIQLFKNCLWYMLVSIPQLLFAFTLAIVVNTKFKGINAFKGIVIFPYLLNGIIVSTIFILFYNPEGTLNLILGFVGLTNLQNNWLQNLKMVNPSIASISIWRYYGLGFLMFYGAMQAIPQDIYEAAALDGANRLNEIRYIIIPYIKKVLFINIILSVSGSIQVFEIPYIMLGGSNGTTTPVIAITQNMQANRVGFSSALSVLVFFIVVVAVSVQRLVVKEEK